MADMTRVFVPRPDKFKRLSYDKSQLKQFNVFKTYFNFNLSTAYNIFPLG
jgi:hypothetical protein